MMMLHDDLPKFQKRNQEYARQFMQRVFEHRGIQLLKEVMVYEDGHFRALFDPQYFGDQPATKSQWNTFKSTSNASTPACLCLKNTAINPAGIKTVIMSILAFSRINYIIYSENRHEKPKCRGEPTCSPVYVRQSEPTCSPSYVH